MAELTEKERAGFWRFLGVKRIKVYEQGIGWMMIYPAICMVDLLNLAVPKVSKNPEIRFRVGYPFMYTLHCDLLTHLPPGNIQEYDYYVTFKGKPTENDYAIVLFRTIQEFITITENHKKLPK
jgi:hypothetical protein